MIGFSLSPCRWYKILCWWFLFSRKWLQAKIIWFFSVCVFSFILAAALYSQCLYDHKSFSLQRISCWISSQFTHNTCLPIYSLHLSFKLACMMNKQFSHHERISSHSCSLIHSSAPQCNQQFWLVELFRVRKNFLEAWTQIIVAWPGLWWMFIHMNSFYFWLEAKKNSVYLFFSFRVSSHCTKAVPICSTNSTY